MLFGHGDDYYNATNEIKVNFSSNVWHGADLRKLCDHLHDRFSVITRYPEPDAGSLKKLLAEQLELEKENIIVTNGSITAFYLIAQAWREARSMILYPSFAEYEDACRLYNHTLRFYPTTEELSDLSVGTENLCWICNPNNPDGRLIDRNGLLELIRANHQTIFIIDQAYAPFTEKELLVPEDIKQYPNLILVESISKVHDVPGLRIGYLIASKEIIAKISPYLIPWSVNALAIEGAKYMLKHPEQYILPVNEWLEQTANFQKELRELEALEVIPSATTFFLARLKTGKALDLKHYLLKEKGLLIRDASNFRGLNESYFRLSTQKPLENKLLIDALKEWFLRL